MDKEEKKNILRLWLKLFNGQLECHTSCQFCCNDFCRDTSFPDMIERECMRVRQILKLGEYKEG